MLRLPSVDKDETDTAGARFKEGDDGTVIAENSIDLVPTELNIKCLVGHKEGYGEDSLSHNY